MGKLYIKNDDFAQRLSQKKHRTPRIEQIKRISQYSKH